MAEYSIPKDDLKALHEAAERAVNVLTSQFALPSSRERREAAEIILRYHAAVLSGGHMEAE